MEEEEGFLSYDIRHRPQRKLSVPKIILNLYVHPYLTIYIFLLHVLVLVFVIKSALLVGRGQPCPGRYSIFPELRSLRTIKSHDHATNHTQYSAYSGPPDTTNAAAWERLIQPLYFNISRTELLDADASPEKSVKVKDGGYIASHGVYHELHCLIKMRNFLYGHRHSQNYTNDELAYWYDHLDHCIELLRLSSMCVPDLSIYSFTWPADMGSSFLDAHSSMPRECVDWDQLDSYTRKRMISLTPTLLYNTADRFLK